MKKRNDLSALTKKITRKSDQFSVDNRFDQADQVLLGTNNTNKLERVIGKSFTLTKHDLENIKLIKEKCLNQRIVVSDSHIIRLALELAVKLAEDILIKASLKIPKILTGRPKGS